MNKKVFALLCVLMAAMLLLGACGAAQSEETATPSATPDGEEDKSTVVVAEVNGEPIYYDDFHTYYASVCQQYGVSEDDATNGAYFKDMVIKSLVNEKILKQKLAEEGYTKLPDDQMEKAKADAEAELDSYVDYYFKTQIEAELGEGYTDEQYQAAKGPYREKMLEQMGMTQDEFTDLFIMTMAQDAAKKDKVGDIVPTEEDVKKKYDESVAADKESMDADPSVYEKTVSSGTTAFYVPEGVRSVRQVLIGIDENTSSAISLLRGEEYNDQADYLLEKALADVKAEADDVLAKIKAGKLTFEDAISQFNDDKGLPEAGYPVTKDTKTYMANFTNGAMGLAKIGDYTDLVSTDYGYHIIEYFKDVPAGPVAFDTVKEEVRNGLVTTLQDEAWKKIVDDWTKASEVVYHEENM